eukprot:1139069-Pelagomonas_calceolata.AAC.3
MKKYQGPIPGIRSEVEGNRERSVPATATGCGTSPASKIRHPSQLLPEERHIHLAKIKYCEDTRPKNQIEASKKQHHNLCRQLSRASAQKKRKEKLRRQ